MHVTGPFRLPSASGENCGSYWFFVQSESGRKLCCMLTKAPVVTGYWNYNASLKVKLQFIHRTNWHNIMPIIRIYVNYHCFQINMVGLDEMGQLMHVQYITCAEPIYMRVSFQYGTEAVRNRMWKHTALIHSSHKDSVKQIIAVLNENVKIVFSNIWKPTETRYYFSALFSWDQDIFAKQFAY